MREHLTESQQADLSMAIRLSEQRHPESVDQAGEALYVHVRADPDLFKAIAEPFVKAYCRDLVRDARLARRKSVWDKRPPSAEVVAVQTRAPDVVAPTAHPNAGRSGVEHLANANRTLMEGFPLPSGKRLGDATKADLLEAHSLYEKQARNMSEKASFLSAVAKRLVGEKRVRDVLNETDLQSLRDDITKKDAA